MEISEDSLFQSVKEIIRQPHEKVFRIANSTLLLNNLKRQINSVVCERIVKNNKTSTENIQSVLKYPYIFEFLGLKANEQFSEKKLKHRLSTGTESVLNWIRKIKTLIKTIIYHYELNFR